MPPERIGYVTFTKRAQIEAIRRAAEKFGRPERDFRYFKTLHSLAYQQSRISSGQLVRGPADLAELGKRVGVVFKTANADIDWGNEFTSMDDGDALLGFDHYRRHRLEEVEIAWRTRAQDSDANIFHAKRFCVEYARHLQHNDLFDFTSLLERPLEALPIDALILDEAQDLSALQWKAFHEIAAQAQQVYMAGDDDQAIYTWAGASPSAFQSHPADEVRVLDQSFRIPQQVQKVANRIVKGIRDRQEKEWKPRVADGVVRRSGELDRVVRQLRQDQDTLILYRNHIQGRDVEAVLKEYGISYTFADGRQPWARQWLTAVIGWERLRKGTEITREMAGSVLSAIATGRGVTQATRDQVDSMLPDARISLSLLRSRGLTADGPWFDALTKMHPKDVLYIRSVLRHHGSEGLLKEPKIRIGTIHGAKGAQADHVVLLLDMTRKTRTSCEDYPDDERRVWYVGVTRAKEELTLVGHDHPFIV
jgi:superfamily I DNA/RNA helicase